MVERALTLRFEAHRNQVVWAGVTLLTVLCGMVAVVQHRWIDQVSQAERDRLHNELKTKLALLARGFQETIDSGVYTLSPPHLQIEREGVEQAYADRLRRWENLHQPLFRRMGVALWRAGGLRLLLWDPARSRLVEAEWPSSWGKTREGIEEGGSPHYDPQQPELLDLPRFESSPPQLTFGHSSEDLLLELNVSYLRDTLIPELLNQYVSDAGKLEFNTRVYAIAQPSASIYQSEDWPKSATPPPDGAISFFEVHELNRHDPGRHGPTGLAGPGPPRGPREPDHRSEHPADRPMDHPDERGPEPERWRIAAYHRAGSLEIIVAQARHRNLLLSSGLLLLVLGTAVLLVRVSQEREKLATLQMNFVAGVSHELRTPLSVIRTAAFNLRGRLSHRPDQVESYGRLIQGESEKLAGLVERVLLFARNQSGEVIYRRSPIEVPPLLQEAIDNSLAGIEAPLGIDVLFSEELPLVFVDRAAVGMALRNIIENAMKYGLDPGNWIGVSSGAVADEKGKWVEIRVADRGQGIPEEERKRVFDAFFRGERAQQDQIHGAGLGLNLAKSAIEANGGNIEVAAGREGGTEFIVRLPAVEDRVTV